MEGIYKKTNEDKEYTKLKVDDTDTTSFASSSQQPLSNLNLPMEIEHAPLNSPTISIITISDDDDETYNRHDEDGPLNFDCNDDQNEIDRKSFYRYNRRLKYKMRRAINILLKYHINDLQNNQISILKNRKRVFSCKRNIRRTANANKVLRARPMYKKRNLRNIESLRRRYLEAIRISHQIMSVWFSDDLQYNFANPKTEYMRWANTLITKDEYVPITRGPDGEIEFNELDYIVRDFERSDTESSSASELSFATSHVTNNYGQHHQRWSHAPYHYNTHNQYKRRMRRLQRRQRLRNRFKVIYHEFYNDEIKCLVSSQSEHLEQEKDNTQNPISTSMVDEVEVIKPIQACIHSEVQEPNSPLGNNTLRSIAQSIAATAKALSSTHIEIFDGILRMAEALYKKMAEPIEGIVDEATEEKQDISVETQDMDDDPYIMLRKNNIMNDLQQTLDSVSKLLSQPVPLNQVKSTALALSKSVETRVRRTELLVNEIVSRRIKTTQPSPSASTSLYQISTIESQKSTREPHRLHLDSCQLLNDDDPTDQQEPGSSIGLDEMYEPAVKKSSQPSPPIFVISPAPDVPESCITDEQPYGRNSRRIVEINRLSPDTATSSHAITSNLLAPPVMRVQRRSRSRTRNRHGPRRLCSLSPPSSRKRIISQEQVRKRSRSPPDPRSPPNTSSTTTDISASTVATTGATAGRPNL